MVTTVASGRVPPFRVAVTFTVLAASSSSRVSGSALSVIPVRASSSVMVVVTRLGRVQGRVPDRLRPSGRGDRHRKGLVRLLYGVFRRLDGEGLRTRRRVSLNVSVPDVAV